MSHLDLQVKVNILTSVLVYLDRQGKMREIKDAVSASKDQKVVGCLVYNFLVDIDLGYLLEQDALLGNCVLTKPFESANLFQEVIHQYCVSQNLLQCGTSSSQISVRFRIKNVPSDNQSLQITGQSDLTKYLDYQGFVKLIGIVSGISSPGKYTQSTKYICPIEYCDGHQGNHYIRMHVPGASETQTIRNDFKCIFCGETLQEVKSLRTLSVKMLIEIVPILQQGMLLKERTRKIHTQGILAFIRDEFVDSVELGKAYEVVGICRKQVNGESINIALEVNNITKLQTKLPPSMTTFPSVIQELYAECQQSPWSFPLNMAYRFGDRVTPGGVMIKLKLLMLMSLVLDPQKNPLHILAIGRDSRIILSVMEFALQFSRRIFPATVTTPLNGKVTDGKHTWSPYFIQSGSLHLSSGGICFVGEVSSWKKANKEQLQSDLQGNKIFLDLAPKHSGGLCRQLSFDLECHVWAVFETGTSLVKTGHESDGQMSGLSKSFIDAFSCACFLGSEDSTTGEEILAEITYHILQSCCELGEDTNSEKNVDVEDFEVFLAVAQQTETRMSPSADNLLRSYYAASRMTRSSGLNGLNLPPSAHNTLSSLAIGFAKLSLRPTVTANDALMAVFLYEENLAARYGLSVLTIQPQPHIPYCRISDFLGKQNDITMRQFHDQLLRFCSCVTLSQSLEKEE